MQLFRKFHRSPRPGTARWAFQQSPVADTLADGRTRWPHTLSDPLLPTAPKADAGELPDMWSPPVVALYAHYACVGVVSSLLTQALLPYCLYVAHGQPNTCATVSTFVNLPWGFKLVYGLVSDCVPICGLHRKPYLVIGWSLTLLCALLLALAPTISLPLASSFFLAMTVAYLFADCAADAALVRFSTREPTASRGSLLATAYSIRFSCNVLASALVAPRRPTSGGLGSSRSRER